MNRKIIEKVAELKALITEDSIGDDDALIVFMKCKNEDEERPDAMKLEGIMAGSREELCETIRHAMSSSNRVKYLFKHAVKHYERNKQLDGIEELIDKNPVEAFGKLMSMLGKEGRS